MMGTGFKEKGMGEEFNIITAHNLPERDIENMISGFSPLTSKYCPSTYTF